MTDSRNKLLYFVLSLLLFVVLVTQAYKADAATLSIYKNCILGNDFGDGVSETLTVTPVGKLCHEICDRECNALSRTQFDVELNADKIIACQRSCKNGDRYSTSSLKTTVSGDTDGKTYSIGSTCSKDPISKTYYHYPHDTGVIVRGGQINENGENIPGENILIKLLGTTNSVGGVFMCGAQTKTIKPKFNSMDYDEMNEYWDDNKSSFDNSTSTWNSRNPNVTNTGLVFKDGDYLKIEYHGDFRWFCQKGAKECTAYPQDRNLLIRKPGIYEYGKDFDIGDYLILPGGELKTYSRNPDGSISGYEGAIRSNASVKFKGMQGRYETLFNDTVDEGQDPPVRTIDTKGRTINQFEGIVEGFSSTYNSLGIMHYDVGSANNWGDNLGGYHVDITRLGCYFTDGDRLQYAITDKIAGQSLTNPLEDRFNLPQMSDWRDVPTSSSLEYQDFPAYKSGKVWLRIKPYSLPFGFSWLSSENINFLPPCAVDEDGCNAVRNTADNAVSPGDSGGQYLVQVVRLQTSSFASNILSNTVRDIRKYFFGEGGGGGIVQTMFNRFVSNSDLVGMIRALLVLYMAATGAAFMIGIAQFTQREAVVRLLSISLVVTLLAPGSWEFFNTYLFQLFINGGLELMANVINYTDYGLPSNAYAQVQEDPALIFTALDKPLYILFSAKTWLKIYALTFSSMVGFIIALAILYAAIIYAVTLIKVMLIYTVSLVMMSILLLLAPIFISFVLFGYTRKMFVTWLNQLMSVTLQPVVVVAGMGIFSTLILLGLYTALGFTVCEGCLFNFFLPVLMDKPFCVMPMWFTLLSKHTPDGVLFPPIVGVGAAFYFLILAQGSYVFCTDIVQRINQIISGFFLGIDLSGYANISTFTSPYTSSMMSAPGFALGTDRTGQQYRGKLKGAVEGALDPARNFAKGANTGFKKTTGIDVSEGIQNTGTKVTDSIIKTFGGTVDKSGRGGGADGQPLGDGKDANMQAGTDSDNTSSSSQESGSAFSSTPDTDASDTDAPEPSSPFSSSSSGPSHPPAPDAPPPDNSSSTDANKSSSSSSSKSSSGDGSKGAKKNLNRPGDGDTRSRT